LIKATVDGMMAREFGRIVNITGRGEAPIEVLGFSTARAGPPVSSPIARKIWSHRHDHALLRGLLDTDRPRGPWRSRRREARHHRGQLLAERAKLNRLDASATR
jgi:3-oxoacyl-[acyl-carrier protein] reductase